MQFWKYQAAGNDFILIDSISNDFHLTPGQIKKMCDRQFGIGADGLMVARKAGGLFEMDFNNPDGSKAEMCGNGIRCFVRFLFDRGHVAEGQVEIKTGAGIKTVDFALEDDRFTATVTIGNPRFDHWEIPATENAMDIVKEYLTEKNMAVEDIALVSVGNPHCIIFVRSLDEIRLEELGPHIENLLCFPNKINVEFSKIVNRSEIDAIVWERGAGRTLACGTGATAVAAAATRAGFTDSQVSVNLPGGTLIITCEADGLLALTGGAEHVFSGHTGRWLAV